jgi:hypothetical protein
MVEKQFLSTVSKWDPLMKQVSNTYQSGNNDFSNNSSSKNILIYTGYSGGTCAYRIEGDKIYTGYDGGTCAYRIEGDKIYTGYSGGNCAYRIVKGT